MQLGRSTTTGDLFLPNTDCALGSGSLTGLFYPKHDYACGLLPEATFAARKATIYANAVNASIPEVERQRLGFFLDKHWTNTGKVQILRTFVQLGQPLEGFKSRDDRQTEQREKYMKLWQEVDEDLFQVTV